MIRVMIVDDEPSARTRYADYVSGSNDEDLTVVARCANATEAIEQLGETKPHVLLTDIRMPGRNGLEMVEEMRRLGWQGHAVVISGYDDFEFAREALRLQMVDYLLKPIFPEDMRKMLDSLRKKGLPDSRGLGVHALGSVDPASLPEFILKALRYIENHYEVHISLADAADAACVSLSYLSREFTHHCGYSFVDVCHRVRVLAAQELLHSGNYTLADIAERVGFTDASHLNRVFRKVTGETPGAYRGKSGSSERQQSDI